MSRVNYRLTEDQEDGLVMWVGSIAPPSLCPSCHPDETGASVPTPAPLFLRFGSPGYPSDLSGIQIRWSPETPYSWSKTTPTEDWMLTFPLALFGFESFSVAETVASPLSATPVEGGQWVQGTHTPQETLRLAGQGTHRAEGREGEDIWRIWASHSPGPA